MSPSEAWDWWESHHSGDDALMAAAAGVSTRTLQRWRQAKAMPEQITALVDQIKSGPAVKTGLYRHIDSVRVEWSETLEPIIETARTRWDAAKEKHEANWSQIWRRNQVVRKEFRMPLPEMKSTRK